MSLIFIVRGKGVQEIGKNKAQPGEGVQLATVEGGRPGAKNIMLRASSLDHVVKARNGNNTTAPTKDSKVRKTSASRFM